MGGPRVAIDATVLAAAIRIDAGLETDVRALVVGYDCLAVVAKELRPKKRLLFRIPFGIGFEMDFLEAIRRIFRCAACGNGGRADAHLERIDENLKFKTPNLREIQNSKLKKPDKR